MKKNVLLISFLLLVTTTLSAIDGIPKDGAEAYGNALIQMNEAKKSLSQECNKNNMDSCMKLGLIYCDVQNDTKAKVYFIKAMKIFNEKYFKDNTKCSKFKIINSTTMD